MLKRPFDAVVPEFGVVPNLSALGSPRFVVTVDTEEEFDWSAPFSRDEHGTSHVSAIPRFQALCDEFAVRPCYLVDYPITQDGAAVDLLGGYASARRAEIGVQLHPWVNPPFAEAVTVGNSFACNLPPELEREKLSVLHDSIVTNLGVRPDVYRAGRYGAGRNTAAILSDLGIAIDSSVRTRFDYSGQGGPSYAEHPINPYWLIKDRVLELPLTTVFGGRLRAVGNKAFVKVFGSDGARSMLARTAMLERIALTPEGIPLDKALEGIDLALADGVKIINLSFHSPSLAVGHTPYVKTPKQLEDFYLWWAKVFVHLSEKGVRPTTMAEVKRASRYRVAPSTKYDLPLASIAIAPLSARNDRESGWGL